MKKQILITGLLLVFTFSLAIGQNTVPKMDLKPQGFIGPDTTKQYVIIEVPKVSKSELYKKTLVYLNSLYRNPQSVLSTVENESITINGYTDVIKGSLAWYKYPMNYHIDLNFKDGKIKLDPKIVDLKEVWAENKPPRQYYIANTDSDSPGEINCIYMYSNKNKTYFLFGRELKKSLDTWLNNYIASLSTGVRSEW